VRSSSHELTMSVPQTSLSRPFLHGFSGKLGVVARLMAASGHTSAHDSALLECV